MIRYLITGGTGSFGKAMVKHLLNVSPTFTEIVIFSRDEDKQELMRREYEKETKHRLSFIIGDIRDFLAINRAMYGVNYVFHAAALKQVPSCEYNPMEAISTNLYGSNNVFKAAEENGVTSVVALSTDKACYPINTMGMTKALMEKLAIDYSLKQSEKGTASNKTAFIVTRYGNVAGSRGSVIPLFINKIMRGDPLTVTDIGMTRFLLSMRDAIELVLSAWSTSFINNGLTMVLNAPASTIITLAKSLCAIFRPGDKEYLDKMVITGSRPGEKLSETLITKEEACRTYIDDSRYVILPYYKTMSLEQSKVNLHEAFTSEIAQQLEVDEMVLRLLDMPFIQEAISESSGYRF